MERCEPNIRKIVCRLLRFCAGIGGGLGDFLLGPGHRLLLPASACLGAILLLAADSCARTVAAPAEIPIGILTALVGAPFFLAVLLRQRSLIGL